MPMDMPPQLPSQPPAIHAPAPECKILASFEVEAAYKNLKARLPGTAFTGASASEICGLAKVQLARGVSAYTDITGRYFMLALALDTLKGGPADLSEAIDQLVDARLTNPNQDKVKDLRAPSPLQQSNAPVENNLDRMTRPTN